MSDALTPPPKKGIVGLLLNPFQVIAGSQALIIGIVVIVISSLIALWIPAAAEDSSAVKHHYLSFDVISACFGTLLGNYEYLLDKHGMCAEASYTFPWLGTRAYEGIIAYRYHFKPAAKGSFVGPFCKFGRSEASIADESRVKYSYTLRYTAFGANWGTRGSLFKSKKLLYTFRIGAAYPWTEFTWKNPPPQTISGLSLHTWISILKINAYLDGELTVTFAL